MARTLDRPAQDALRGKSSGPPPGRVETPGAGTTRGDATRCMFLLGVEGYEGMLNDVLFKPALRRSGEEPPRQRTLVFFGGDVQNFLHLMDQNNTDKPANDWCLETTACRLGAGYPYHHIVVIKPIRIVMNDISCYDNFVPGNRVGAPKHTYHYSGVPHLEKLLKTISRKLKKMQTEELCEMLFKTDNEDETINVDQEENNPGSKVIRMSVRQMEMYCWWQKRLKLHKYRLTLVAFSKGCVVLNQFLYEYHYAKHLAPENQDSSFINRVEAMYWLDGGHPGQSNTWITARAQLHTLTLLGICVHVHVSKYQVEDQTRPWIGKEEKEFVATLRTLGAMVFRHLHVFETTDLFAHFNVLAKFMEVEKSVGRQLTQQSSSFSDPGSGPSPSDSGSSQNSGPSDPQNPAPGSQSPSSHDAAGGSSEPGPSDDYDALSLINSIAIVPSGNDRSEPQTPASVSPNPTDSICFSNFYSGSFEPSNTTDPSSSTSNFDPVSTLFPNLEETVKISLIKSLWELYLALYVLLAAATGNKSKSDTNQLYRTSKSPIEILSTATTSENCEINLLVVPKIMVVPRRKTINTYSDVMIAPVICVFEEDSAVFNPVGIYTTVRYNHVFTPGVRDNTSLVTYEYVSNQMSRNDSDSDTAFPVPNSNVPTAGTLASQQTPVNANTFHNDLPTASVLNAVTSILNSTGQRVNGPPVPMDGDTATPANCASATLSVPVSTATLGSYTTVSDAPGSTAASAIALTATLGPVMPSAPVSSAPSTPISLVRSPASLSAIALAAYFSSAPSAHGLTTVTSPISTAASASVITSPASLNSIALAASFSIVYSGPVSTVSTVAPVSFARLTPYSKNVIVPVSAIPSDCFSNMSAAIFSTAPSAPVSAAPSAPIFTAPVAPVSTSPANLTSTAPATLDAIALAALDSSALAATAFPPISQIRRPRRNSCSDLPSQFQPDISRELRGNSMPSDIDYYAKLAAPSDDTPAPHNETPAAVSGGGGGLQMIVRHYDFPLVDDGCSYVYYKFDLVNTGLRRPRGRRSPLLNIDSDDESANREAERFSDPELLSVGEPDDVESSESGGETPHVPDLEMPYAQDVESPAAEAEPSVESVESVALERDDSTEDKNGEHADNDSAPRV